MPRLLSVLFIGTAIPLLGYLVDSWLGPFVFLRQACAIAGILGVSIPIIFLAGASYAGQSRARISAVFPLLVRLSVVLLAIMVLLQGAILTYSAFLAEAAVLGRVHVVLIGGIGIGALIGGFGLIGSAAQLGGNLQQPVAGTLLSRDKEPKLYAFVESLAGRLGARPPDHIVVGLEPNFFVTSADLVLPGHGVLTGESMFVSTSLARLLTRDELAAVVGHELGHFRGGDTEYSTKFAPVYARLGGALEALESESDSSMGLAQLPAAMVLGYMAEVFATNERTIGRKREFEADRAGAEASSRKALATALVKVSLYAGLWEQARSTNVDRLNEGRITRNLSSVFQDLAKYDVEHDSLEELKAKILEEQIAHPTDTHPPTSQRLQALGVSPEEIDKSMLTVPEAPAIELLDSHVELEQTLTALEHQLMIAFGLVSMPESDEDRRNYVLQCTYALAASMVGADGRIDPEEIAIAERVGGQLFEDFDPVEFREACNNLENGPNLDDLSDFLASVLDQDHKASMVRYLKAIAEADGEVSSEEQALLENVASKFEVSLAELGKKPDEG